MTNETSDSGQKTKRPISQNRESQILEATLHKWALSLGIDRKSLVSAMARQGVAVREGEKVPARIIFNAITGDKEAAMTRKLLAEAEEKERDNRIANGEIITVEDAATIYGKKVAALVQKLEALPATVPGITFEQRQILSQQIETCKAMAREAK